MNQPTQEQIKEFWEWCGIVHAPGQDYCFEHEGWHRVYEYPDGHFIDVLPKLDLNNLFKYAIPRLYELGWSYELKGYTYHIVDLYGNNRKSSSKGMRDPALALFWAIWKMIKETGHEGLTEIAGSTGRGF